MRPLVCFLLAPALWAAPILNLSNFQSSAQVSTLPTGSFFGFEFSTVMYDSGDPLTAYLPIGGGGYLTANTSGMQTIDAHASVDFSVPGYLVTRVMAVGFVYHGGAWASADYTVSTPCHADSSQRVCAPPYGLQSGTITASMQMYTTQQPMERVADGSEVRNPTLMLTLEPMHSPEPGTFGLVLLAVGAITARYRPGRARH